MVNIIIIGAGAAGLAAASRLIEKGVDQAQIQILEAENRIGGRILTVPYGNFLILDCFSSNNLFYNVFKGSSLIEMGAQWVHGKEGNVVYPLAAAAGEIRTDFHTEESTGYDDNVEMAYRNGRKISPTQLKEFKKVLKDIYDSSKRELVQWKGSLGEYFTHK